MNAIIRKLEGKLEVTTDQTEEEIKSKAMLFIDRQRLKTAANIFGSGGKEDQQRAEIFTAVAADNFSAAVYPLYKSVFFTASGSIKSAAGITKCCQGLSRNTDFYAR